LEDLRTGIREFVAERDWEQFHSPKNLAMALSVEASEIVEHFQWLTEEQSRNLPPEKLAEIREEIGDVMIAPAKRHDSPLLEETLDTLEVLGELPERMRVHLDRSYDSQTIREKLKCRGLEPMISEKGKPAPLQTTKRWVVSARTRGTTLTRSSCGVPSAGIESSISGSPSQRWSSP
jgi:hypothetical protein